MCISTHAWTIFLTVLDAQNHIAKPTSASLFVVRVGSVINTNLHDDALLTHLQNHIQRIFLRIIQDLNQRNEIVMVQLLHNRDFLFDQIQRVVCLWGEFIASGHSVEGLSSLVRSSQQVGLSALAQARFGKLLDGILVVELVDGEVDCAKGTAAYFLLDGVLVYFVDGCAVVVAGAVLRSRIECFLCVVCQGGLR